NSTPTGVTPPDVAAPGVPPGPTTTTPGPTATTPTTTAPPDNTSDPTEPTDVPPPPPPTLPELVTSGVNDYWKVGTLTDATGNATLSVDEGSTFQEWTGMGGTFNEAGWDALAVLDAAERDRAMRLLFDGQDGARLAWGRIPIGASDYALERYTLNDTPNDVEMTNFSIERDKMYLIPYIKAAMALKPDLR